MQRNLQTTERLSAEPALCPDEAESRRARQSAMPAHVVTGRHGEFLSWSDMVHEIAGCNTLEMPRSIHAWLELIHPDDRQRFRRTCMEATRNRIRVNIEYRLQHARGHWIEILHIIEPLDSPRSGDKHQCRLNILHNISAARHSPQALTGIEERYRSTFDQTAVAIVHTSLEGRLCLVNQAFCAMAGYSRAEALRLNIRDITHAEDMEASSAGRTKLVDGSGPSHRIEFQLLRKDGSYVWACVTTSLVRGDDDRPLYFVSVLIDIAQRKRAEQEVNRLRAAVDVSIECIFLADPKSMQLLYVNETLCRRLGYTREQLLQKPPFELVGKTREQLVEEDEQVISAGERGICTQTSYVRSDGTQGWTEVYRRALPTESDVVIVTITRDITETRAQQRKIERLSRVHAALSGINEAIVRIRDRQELFRESCRIAHEAGGFDVVWIGLTNEQSVAAEPLACHGLEASVARLKQLASCFNEDEQGGRGMLVAMLKAGKPTITNDALNDTRVGVRHTMAELGINSIALLPLLVSNRVEGVMAMYSPYKGHFDDAEIKLLSDLAADISFALEHLEKCERASYLALYDELTGLANRRLLIERLGQFVHAAGRAQERFAVAIFDIERLRSVNESLGRHFGDALLREVAGRLERVAGAGAVGRIASDHFVVVLLSIKDEADAGRSSAGSRAPAFQNPTSQMERSSRSESKPASQSFPTMARMRRHCSSTPRRRCAARSKLASGAYSTHRR
jgi:PAS domain S-box-containing protein